MSDYTKIGKAFERNGMKFDFFKDAASAKEAILDNIKGGESVTFGGSMTLDSIGLYDDIKTRGNDIYWHWKEDKLPEIPTTDIYVAGSNAITEDGKIVNKDGTGNRVAGMIHGPKKVFIVVGKNKIVKDYDAAIKRIEEVAAPLNAKRWDTNTPCVKTGVCSDCNSEGRICNVETVIARNPKSLQLSIYLIDEELGY